MRVSGVTLSLAKRGNTSRRFVKIGSSTVNKTEMAKKLAKKADLSQAKAAEVIDIIFSSESGAGLIAVELDADREVSVSGFGKFYTSRSKARTGRNPATGETIQIAAKKHAKFKPAKGLKDRVAV